MASWNPLSNQPTFNADTMLLLTDGTVMCHEFESSNWHRLTPDASGSYANGVWSSLQSLPNNPAITAAQGGPSDAPLYFASAVLRDGRVFQAGGEYNGSAQVDMGPAQIYDPVADQWTIVKPPPDLVQIGDATSCMLADGRLIIGDSAGSSTAVDILDPNTMIYEPTGAKGDSPSEETWTLLPNGNVLAVQCSNAPNAEQYNPTTNTWISAGSTPGTLPQPCSGAVAEIGPALLLPDGRVFAIGASGATALYTPNADPTVAGTWTAGPTLTDGHGNTMYPMDAPAALLPSGKVLLTASPAPPCSYPGPTTFFLYDPSSNTAPIVTGPSSNSTACYFGRLLLVPDGTVLFSNGSNDIEVYTPDGSPQQSWAPVITNAPATMVIGDTYTISGAQFNGLSQACSYGDDAQMATNYPIVRLRQGSQKAYLRSSSFSTMGVATGTALVTCDITVSGAYVTPGTWQLEVIANGIVSNAVSVTIAAQDCQLLTQNSDFNAGEITAIIETTGSPARIPQAAFVIVDGFTKNQIGTNVPLIPNPAPQISYAVAGPPAPADASLPANAIQSFTFTFTASFTDTSVFGTSDQTLPLSVNFTSADNITVQAQGEIYLLATPNPYILHGDSSNGAPFYLSVDLGVFQVTAGQAAVFGASIPTSGSIKTNAHNFIHTVIGNLNAPSSTVTGQFAGTVSLTEDSTVNLLHADSSGNPIYNFALARVRFQDVNPADHVRVFFRMWQAQQTNATYDTATYYRSYANGTQKIPLLGLEGDEIMTIPFFAAERVDSTNVSMTTQTDADNVQDIQPGAGGALTEAYFGCWLDVNQSDTYFPPWMAGVSNVDGPYNGGEPLVSVLQLVRATHQCLIAEIAFDPDPIPPNADPSISDKLAQRNLSFINIPNPGIEASRIAPQTFEIKPSSPKLLPAGRVDELMISWEKIPRHTSAEIYLPAIDASTILALADKLYPVHTLVKVDAHTIGCKATGFTYIPIPQSGLGQNYMGLMSLAFPGTVRKGDSYGVTVRQLTSVEADYDRSNIAATAGRDGFTWRRVAGIFHLTIPVSTKEELLYPEERILAVMRFIEKTIPAHSRWYPIFERYLKEQSGRVAGMGGDPTKIPPNWQGILPGRLHLGGGEGDGSKDNGGDHVHDHDHDREFECRGKIAGIRYDHFGDFEGFILAIGCDTVRCFDSRELKVEKIVQRALAERWTVTILCEEHDPCCPTSIIISGTPDCC